jgi:hypothetical protein
MNELTAPAYRELIQAALPSTVDADTVDPDLHTLFTPDSHRLALDPDVTVVRGARGVGKTVWFKALQRDSLRAVAAEAYQLPRLNTIDSLVGYGSQLEPHRYPGPATLTKLVHGSGDPSEIWATVLLQALEVTHIASLPSWAEKIQWVRDHPDALDMALAQADAVSSKEGKVRLLLFDALDRLHVDRQRADELAGGVLRLALDLRTRTRSLRAKVFIRRDMFESAERQFPDASKLTANATDLTWSPANLYGLLFHQMGNAKNPLAGTFRTSTPLWTSGGAERYTPPYDVVGDGKRQQELFTRVAGTYMGTDHRKGYTYTWLTNHLTDGVGEVSPRSFLSALTKAAEVTKARFAGHELALHYEGIRQGVQAASRIRVAEVNEDLPWVATALTQLEGLQVPIDQRLVVERWREVDLATTLRRMADVLASRNDEAAVRTGPGEVDDYDGLIRQLIELGVMSRRADGRIDLPDVYRIAFRVGRKGGIPRFGS